jgi:quercetin 2,3-dioxygenase
MTTNLDYTLRRADARGHLVNDWLQARLSFSFGSYVDADWQCFGPLVAFNEDIVQPDQGFPMHPHRDLEILMIPVSGAIAHADSLGHRATVSPGEVLFMRAGAGIAHSQLNASALEIDHHYQIWIEPHTRGMPPSVDKRAFGRQRPGIWTTLASAAPCLPAFTLLQDVAIHRGAAAAGLALRRPLQRGRSYYLQVVRGRCSATLSAQHVEQLENGDALALYAGGDQLLLEAACGSVEFLLVDVPANLVRRNRTKARVLAGK